MTTLNQILSGQLKRITEDINGKITAAQKFGTRAPFLNKQARILAEQIVRRTRLGKGVNDAGKQTRLAPLKDSTKKQRRRYQRNLTSKTTPGRSNISATGQLLDSVRGRASGAELIVFALNNRTRSLSGGRSSARHSDIITGLESGRIGKNTTTPRPFFRVSDPERNQIARNIREEVLKSLNS